MIPLAIQPDFLAAVHPPAGPAESADAADRLGPLGFVAPGSRLGVVAVEGVLTREPHPGTIGYAEIIESLAAAADDDRVDAVLLHLHSPGGEVWGCEEAVRAVAELHETKPVTALAADMACSAAYWLACAAGEVVITPAGCVGSIGVANVMFDESEWYRQMGLRVIAVTSGTLKHGFPGEPIGDELVEHQMEQVDELFARFAADVAARRRLPARRIADDQARVFTGRLAVGAGLADRTAHASAVYAELMEGIQR